MRLPRLRFTIRRLMLAVLITALLLGGLVGAEKAIRLRRTYCLKHAAYCARMMDRTMPSSSSTPEERAALTKRNVYFAVQRAEFEYAADRFWVDLPPELSPE